MSAAGASTASPPPNGQNQDEPLLLVLTVAMLAVELSELQAASKQAHAAMMRVRIESFL
jgi:hypothetical protein